MATKEVLQPLYSAESLMDFAKRKLNTPAKRVAALFVAASFIGIPVVGANMANESNTGNSIKSGAAEPVKASNNLGVTVVITQTSTIEPEASDCSRINTPDANTWMQLIPGPYGAHQEFCPTPVAISLDSNAPKDSYSLLADKMIAGQASKADILNFNDDTIKRNSAKGAPQADELTSMQGVITDASGERILVNGLYNNKGELQSYWDKNGSFIQVK